MCIHREDGDGRGVCALSESGGLSGDTTPKKMSELSMVVPTTGILGLSVDFFYLAHMFTLFCFRFVKWVVMMT